MKVGTKSLLFGAHQFILHPILVAEAWRRIYGWRSMVDLRLWVAFVVHDWGYWGKPNMDGPEGEWHPALGAGIMAWLFDVPYCRSWPPFGIKNDRHWFHFMFYHSRFLAKRYGAVPSRLCWADKLAITLYPRWLYWVLSHMSGEIDEYMNTPKLNADIGIQRVSGVGLTFDEWWGKVNDSMKRQVKEATGYVSNRYM